MDQIVEGLKGLDSAVPRTALLPVFWSIDAIDSNPSPIEIEGVAINDGDFTYRRRCKRNPAKDRECCKRMAFQLELSNLFFVERTKDM